MSSKKIKDKIAKLGPLSDAIKKFAEDLRRNNVTNNTNLNIKNENNGEKNE